MLYDVVVIGGGASGMMAAGTAGSLNKKTLLIEKNEKLGKKLYLTGKGRCNITNILDIKEFLEKVPRNSSFLYSSLNNYYNQDIINFFSRLGLATKIERGGRVFPVTDKSSDVIKCLVKYLKLNNVSVMLGTEVITIFYKDNKTICVRLLNQDIISTKSVIIATGGLSYPMTGSNGDGYKFAKKLGHRITDLYPALVPLEVKENYIRELQGLTLKNVMIYLKTGSKMIFKDFGELIFTHYGLSGPLILTASCFINKKLDEGENVSIQIDLKPYMDYLELDKRILKDFGLFPNKQFSNSLDNLLPKKIIPLVVRLSGILDTKAVNQISREERKRLGFVIKNLVFIIKNTRPISEAIITHGGISVNEINPKTMESKIAKGLYFSGEILDVHGFTGGINLQIAFSTGYAAGYYA